MNRRTVIGTVAAAGLMLCIQIFALALAGPFQTAGYEAVDDPTNPAYSAMLFGAILVATAFMLLAFRYDFHTVMRWAVIAISGVLTFYVLSAISPGIGRGITIGVFDPLAIAGGVLVVGALLYYPEWYVIDAAAIVIGAGAAAIFGISFSILPIVILLIVLAIYDAVSVYGTKHMLTLAEGAMSMRLPVLVIIPVTLDFSASELNQPTASAEEGEKHQEDASTVEERETGTSSGLDAIFLGLGDIVIPSILIVAVATADIGDTAITIVDLAISWPVVGAIVGTLVGLIALLILVFRGAAHAGLPLLNGGVILGYIIAAYANGINPLSALGIS